MQDTNFPVLDWVLVIRGTGEGVWAMEPTLSCDKGYGKSEVSRLRISSIRLAASL